MRYTCIIPIARYNEDMKTNPLVIFYGSILSIMFIVGTLFVAKNLATGFVIENLGISHCTTEQTCWHEGAHQMDIDRGRISEAPEYQTALGKFTAENPAWRGWYEHNNWHELYAQMWETAGGNIDNVPAELQEFYR